MVPDFGKYISMRKGNEFQLLFAKIQFDLDVSPAPLLSNISNFIEQVFLIEFKALAAQQLVTSMYPHV